MLSSKYLNKQIAYSLLYKAIAVGSSLALVSLLIGHFGKEKYGVWVTIFSSMNWLVFFDFGLGLGLRNKLTESIASGDSERSKIYISTSYAVLFVVFAGVFLISYALSGFLNWNELLNIQFPFDENILVLIRVVLALICLRLYVQVIRNILFAIQRSALKDMLESLGQVIMLGVLIGAFFFVPNKSMTLAGAIYVGVPTVIFTVFSILFFHRKATLRPSLKFVKVNQIKPLLGLGLEFLILQLGALFLIAVIPILITSHLGPDVTAEYNIVYKYLNVMMVGGTVILNPYWSAVTDAYVKKEYNWIKAKLKRNLLISLVLGLGSLLLALMAEVVFEYWVKDIQVPVHTKWWTWGLVCSFIITQPVITFLNGIGKTRHQMWISVFIILSTIPIGLLLYDYGLGVAAFLIPPTFFRFFRSIYGLFELKKILSDDKADS